MNRTRAGVLLAGVAVCVGLTAVTVSAAPNTGTADNSSTGRAGSGALRDLPSQDLPDGKLPTAAAPTRQSPEGLAAQGDSARPAAPSTTTAGPRPSSLPTPPADTPIFPTTTTSRRPAASSVGVLPSIAMDLGHRPPPRPGQ